MTLIIPDGYCQVVIEFSSATFEKGVGQTSFGARLETGQSLSSYAANVALNVDSILMQIMDTSVTLSSVRTFDAEEGAEELVGEPGRLARELPPPNVCLLVEKPTTRRGPRGRGRMYWPGLVSENQVSESGQIDSDTRNGLQLEFTALYEALTPTLSDIVILQNEEGASTPISPPPVVTGLGVDPVVATQRRRLR